MSPRVHRVPAVEAPQLRLPFEQAGAAASHAGTPGGSPLDEVVFLRHPRARRYVLRLTTDGRARVTIPRGGSRRQAERFLQRHVQWLDRERRRWHAEQRRHARGWRVGDAVWWRGRPVALEIALAGDRWGVRVGDAVVPVPTRHGCVRDAVVRHLRAVAARELPRRVGELARQHGLQVGRVVVRDQRSRWGSCSPSGTISLNWRLVQMPAEVSDYVVLHELMHLRVANHSRRFWKLLANACPWHPAARAWLRRHGRALL